MAERRSKDEIVLKGGARETSVKEVDNSDGPKVGDEKDSKLGFDVPRFGDWDDNSPAAGESYTHIFNKVRQEKGSQEFGRDTNRLDYFSVTAFNVLGNDDDLTTITDYGGGMNREVVAGPLLKQDRSTANGGDGETTKVEQDLDRGSTGVGDTSRQIPMRDVANNVNGGGEMVVETPEQERDSGGKKRIGDVGRGLRWWDKWCYCCHCG